MTEEFSQHMQNTPEIEKRVYTRVKTKIPVNYLIRDLEGKTKKIYLQGKTYTYDVSQGGVRLPVLIPPKKLLGGDIYLEFRTQSLVRASGQIRWFHRGHQKDHLELGVEFIGIKNADRHHLLLHGFQQQNPD